MGSFYPLVMMFDNDVRGHGVRMTEMCCIRSRFKIKVKRMVTNDG